LPRIDRNSWLWISFGLLLVVALTAVGTLSVAVWRLDQSEVEARRAAAIEENLRLALWRMDTALTPFLARENARPFGEYLARDQFPESLPHGIPGGASPDPASIERKREWVVLRFELALEQGNVSRPGSEEGKGEISEDRWQVETDRPFAGTFQPADWFANLNRRELWERLPRVNSFPPMSPIAEGSAVAELDTFGVRSRAAAEFSQRSQSVALNNAMVQQLNAGTIISLRRPSLLMPLWQSNQLLLVRRIEFPSRNSIQGCILDWGGLQQWLLESSKDLLSEARLEPVDQVHAAGEPGLLAALPLRLVPGTLPMESLPPQTAIWPTLLLAWSGVLTAVLAGGFLLQGVVSLSQRRASFVSAVTHELRTPLTTFQMYTEMLARDMITNPTTRREYLETLHAESLRLSHLVENVLAFARLERGRGNAQLERLPLERVLSRCLPRLEQLAGDSQMHLIIEPSPFWKSLVCVDESLVEQIMRNLIDNACKYGVPATERRIEFQVEVAGQWIRWRVRDFGPGLPEPRRWYRPFSKSAYEAAHSAPGIGLGLALSRRLARQMGATLEMDRKVNPGACFVLSLRRSAGETVTT
jgi:signal transduction histidine kinase